MLMETLFIGDTEHDTLTFGRIYQDYHQVVYANILKFIKSGAIAEDILQDVFYALWENRLKIDGTKSVAGWLFVVSYNKSLNHLRRKVREAIDYVADYEGFMHLPQDNVADKAFYEAQLQVLEEAIVALPAQRQQVFRLCYYEGKSQEEAASILGLSAASVKDYLKLAKKSIRAYVGSKMHLNEAVCVSLIILTFY